MLLRLRFFQALVAPRPLRQPVTERELWQQAGAMRSISREGQYG